ncbi:hypothetical protein, partial [Escherichia coli]|uniref:hypothetical protein n=1 Tax=Escherichia coli TaxID=562 RepID=UPI0019543DDE
GLFKDRCATVAALAEWLVMYFAPVSPAAEDLAVHVTDAVRPAISTLAEKLSALTDWNKSSIQQALKETLTASG